MNASALMLKIVGALLPPQELRFRDFFRPGAPELWPSERLLSLDGRRVRLVGFVAQAEEPPAGGYFLCPFPIAATDSGAVDDLPPQAVLVVDRSAHGDAPEHRNGPIQVTGVLDLGAGGEPWPIRILLDPPPPTAHCADRGRAASPSLGRPSARALRSA